jgi:hypothetical protein
MIHFFPLLRIRYPIIGVIRSKLGGMIHEGCGCNSGCEMGPLVGDVFLFGWRIRRMAVPYMFRAMKQRKCVRIKHRPMRGKRAWPMLLFMFNARFCAFDLTPNAVHDST